MSKPTIDTNNMCVASAGPVARRVDQVPVSIPDTLDPQAEAAGLAQRNSGLGPIGTASRTPVADKLGDLAHDSLYAAADNGGPRKRVNQFPNGKNDPDKGPFQSYPAETGDEGSA
jgi:hypothetical protein